MFDAGVAEAGVEGGHVGVAGEHECGFDAVEPGGEGVGVVEVGDGGGGAFGEAGAVGVADEGADG